MDASTLRCTACGGPVIRNQDQFETFERMHWVCFHYEFEHDSERDRDVACRDPSCPTRQIDQAPPPTWYESGDPKKQR